MKRSRLYQHIKQGDPVVQPISSSKSQIGIEFTLMMVVLIVFGTFIFYFVHTSRLEIAEDDYFIEWKGSQIALQGSDPYSDAATQQIQYGLHRYNVTADQDQLAFVYPYWRIFYNAPLNLLPYNWAAAFWLAFRLALFVGSIYLVCKSINWRHRKVQQQIGLYLSLILAFPTFAALMEGQVALLTGSLLVFTYYCLRNGAQGWAGIWLALATVKPQLAAILILLLIFRAVRRGEWKFIRSFSLTFAILVIASFAAYPNWLGEFLQGITRYPGYKKSLTGPGFLFDGTGTVGTILAIVTWLLIAAIGLYWWWLEANQTQTTEKLTANQQFNSFDISFSLGIFLTLLLPPQTNVVNALLLEVPIVLLMARWATSGKWISYYALAVANVVVTWCFYFAFFNNFYGWLIVAPVSLITILFVYNFKSDFLKLIGVKAKRSQVQIDAA